jgi:hypothetical protein
MAADQTTALQAAIYIFFILSFILSPKFFVLLLGVLIVTYLIQPTIMSELGVEIFQNMTWIYLALVVVAAIAIAAGAAAVKKSGQKMKHDIMSAAGLVSVASMNYAATPAVAAVI